MKKVIPILALTAFTVLGAASACAQELTVNESFQFKNMGERIKRESRLTVNNESFSGTQSTRNFDIPQHYGNVKVWVKNSGEKEMSVTVEKGNQQKMSVTIQPGKSWTGYSDKAYSTGTHTIQVVSPEDTTKGQMSVRVSNQKY